MDFMDGLGFKGVRGIIKAQLTYAVKGLDTMVPSRGCLIYGS